MVNLSYAFNRLVQRFVTNPLFFLVFGFWLCLTLAEFKFIDYNPLHLINSTISANSNEKAVPHFIIQHTQKITLLLGLFMNIYFARNNNLTILNWFLIIITFFFKNDNKKKYF